jgi:hypothetical protein
MINEAAAGILQAFGRIAGHARWQPSVFHTKRWNLIHGSKDHLWGSRFFARTIKDPQEYESVMNYIDQNAVAVGLPR